MNAMDGHTPDIEVSTIRNVPIEFSRTIQQPYKEADPYQETKKRTPDSIKEKFQWASHLIEPKNIRSKFDAFSTSTNFPVSGEELTKTCEDTFAFCRSVYDTTLFPPPAPQLPYHNIEHALITSITAQKIFLGGLVQEVRNGTIPMPSKDQIVKMHKLFSMVAAFHEIDDWWNLAYPGGKGKTNPHIHAAKNALRNELTRFGISTHDFNRMLALDDFRESQETSLQKSLDMRKEDGFLHDNHTSSQFDRYSPQQLKKFFSIGSGALCAGDFLQVINPAYIQPMIIDVDGTKSVMGYSGPFALASEMSLWRKKALGPSKFGNPETGEVHWNGISLNLGFFEGVALPRINSGIDYLRISAPSEYKNAQDVIANKLAFLHKTLEASKLE